MKRLNHVIIFLAFAGMVSLYSTASARVEAHPWNVNNDGVVDLADLMFIGMYLKAGYAESADVNGDGSVNIADMVLVVFILGRDTTRSSGATARLWC